MKCIFWSFLIFSSWPLAAHSECIVIDGPANLRKEPKGEIIQSLPDLSTVWVTASEKPRAGWIPITFEKTKHGPIRCSAETNEEVFVTGWISEKNRKKISNAEFLKLDPLAYLWGLDLKEAKPTHSAVIRKTAQCAEIIHPYHDRSSGELKSLTAGTPLKGECTIRDDGVVCEFQQGSGSKSTVCPKEYVDLKPLVLLTRESRLKLIREAGEKARAAATSFLSLQMLSDLQKKYPHWLPLVMPHPKRDTPFSFDLERVESQAEFFFPFQSDSSKRKVLIFFDTPEAALEKKTSIAFEGKGKVTEFRKLPDKLRVSKKNSEEDRPTFCIGTQGDFLALTACSHKDEIAESIFHVDFRTDPPSPITEQDFKKNLKLPGDYYWCCSSEMGKFEPFK